MSDHNNDKTQNGITRRDFLATSAAAATLGALGLSGPVSGGAEFQAESRGKSRGPRWLRGRRPNFLILMCDEMRYPPPYETEFAKAFRQTYLKTQNALRMQGMEFHRHYAASVACVPSRASLYTGHYPSLHGVTQTTGAAKEAPDPDVFWLDPNSVPTIGDYFRAGGYQTYWKGKWHASDADLILPGTNDPIPSYDSSGQPVPAQEALYLEADRLDPFGFSGWIGPEPHGKAPLNSASSAKDARGRDIGFADQAEQLIQQLDDSHSQQPWLIVSSFLNPHDITLWGLAARLSGSFDFTIEDIVPEFLLQPAPSGPTQSENLAENNKPRCQASYKNAYHSVFQPILFEEEYVRFYYQLHKNVDEQMMRVYQTLLNSRFSRDTIVIFTSDHGDLLGSHGGLHQKWYTAYEEVIHVPLIISNPYLFPQPRSVDTLTSHVDLLPTLLGLAGLDQEKLREQLARNHTDAQPLVGRDLSPLILSEVSPDAMEEAPIYFMTDDDPSRGLDQDNWTGIPYNSVVQPNHIETVIARLSDGKLWKYSRYFDNPQFWSDPETPPSDTVVMPPREPLPTAEGTYTLEYTVTVKESPVPDEFEMYNLTDDPLEQTNLYGNFSYQARQQELAALLAQQCEQKRLIPNTSNGTVPSQPAC
jgi:choline-sulfatase